MVRCIVLLISRGSLRWLPVVGFVFLWMVGPGAGCATAIVSLDGTWINDSGSGTWEDADTGSWLDSIVATGINATADFSTLDIAKDNTVSLGAARTIGNLVFGDSTTPSNDWTLDGGTSSYILTLSAVVPSIEVKNQTATISASIAGTNGLNLTGAGTLILSGSNSYDGGTNLAANSSLVVKHINALGVGDLTINDSAVVTLQPGLARPLQLPALTIEGGVFPIGQLDITNNGVIVHNGDLQVLHEQLAYGMNGGGAYWNGPGITSSTAADEIAHDQLSAVGLILNDDGAGGVLYDKWPGTGEELTNTDVLIRYTKFGDADLNGIVDNGQDYLLWLAGFLNPDLPRTWMYGDFDYDGKVDGYFDYTWWQFGFAGLPPSDNDGVSPSPQRSLGNVAITSVPEPSSLVLAVLGLAAAAMARFRPRKK